jgi:hypothetical protein
MNFFVAPAWHPRGKISDKNVDKYALTKKH